MEISPLEVNISIVVIFIYFFYLREFLLARKEFKCQRCGQCCKLRVFARKEDRENLKKAGYLESDFLTKLGHIKKINGFCVFMTVDNGITSCNLHDSCKPSICRTFPNSKVLFGKR